MKKNNYFRMVSRKILIKILLKINKNIRYLNNIIDRETLPRFKNNIPKDFTMHSPREIKNPERIIIGENVKLGANCVLKAITSYPGPWLRHPESNHIEQNFNNSIIKIGDRVTSTGYLYIAAANKVIIEDDVMFAMNVFISDCSHGNDNADIPYKYQGLTGSPVTIKKGSWIGKNVVILPGVTVGELSIIGANSVVTKNVPDRCIAAGSPAKIIKKWCRSSKKWMQNKG